jgi:hypothetical protein
MATVNKNFRIKQGLVVEGTTGTINGQNILTETGSDTYILNLIGGETLVKSVNSTQLEVSAGGELSVKANVFDAYGSASTAQSNAEDYADGLASNYDPAGSAATAQSNAEDYADGLASNYDPAGSAATAQSNAEDYADGLASNYDPAGSAATAQSNAEGYADGLISTEVTNRNSAITAAVDALVDGAPGLLDTLNEIAAAIADDENYATTMTTALAGKQDELTASTGITIDGSNNISVTANTYDAYGAASTAQSNAEDYADGLASNYDAAGSAATAQSNAEGYADGLADDILDGTSAFTAINVNSVAKQVAATTGNIVTAAATTAYSWAALDFRSAKFIVKAKYGAHTQVSDLVVTLDTSNNVAVSEYGITYSNGTELAAVTADYSGTDVRIRVTPANNNTEVVVVGTLIK